MTPSLVVRTRFNSDCKSSLPQLRMTRANSTLNQWALGQVVATLVDEHKEPGFYQVRWNPNVPSGIYFYRLQAGEFLETKTMVLLG